MAHILFISHEASRTGAPIVLLHLLRWLRNNSDLTFDVLLLEEGPLEDQFREVASRCYVVTKKPKSFLKRNYERVMRTLNVGVYGLDKIICQLRNNHYSLVYANTCATSQAVIQLKKMLQAPVIMHIHELEYVIRMSGGRSFIEAIPYVNRFIAVSEIVRDNLVNKISIPSEQIGLIPGFIPKIIPSSVRLSRDVIRKQLEIPLDAFIVGGCGTMDWRKGNELFVLVANRVLQEALRVPIHFIWVGGEPNTKSFIEMQIDVKKLGIADRVYFVGSQSNPLDYFNTFDVFLMTSREDPFPLVCLENASLGNPIICFENAIGSTEYIDNTCGHVSPYLDLDAMVKGVLRFYNDNEDRMKCSQHIREVTKKYTVDNCGQMILREINAYR